MNLTWEPAGHNEMWPLLAMSGQSTRRKIRIFIRAPPTLRHLEGRKNEDIHKNKIVACVMVTDPVTGEVGLARRSSAHG